MRWAVVLVAVGLATPELPGEASASVLCRTQTNTLIVRDACKRRERVVTPEQQVEIGMQGPGGPSGPSGPNARDLKVVDSTGHEVGVVMSLAYYGTATVVGSLTVPGAAAPEFYVFTVGTRGLDTRESTSCTDFTLQYYRSSDCNGGAFANCDYGACSSVSGAFLARPLFGQDASTVCYAGDASEFQRGDFYQRFDVAGISPDDVAARCTSLHGTLLEPAVACGKPRKPRYCAPCCRRAPNVAVSPVHRIDAGVVGTPPFRLSR